MGTLFWKIFLSFWLTLILIAGAVSWGTAIYIQNSDAYTERDLRARYVNSRIELLNTYRVYSIQRPRRQINTFERMFRPFQRSPATRVSHAIGNRKDEISALGHDFDQMAIRLQSLVNNQKQLLSDISHELRSPLARMQLAVGLAQKKAGPSLSNEMSRIEQETERLDDLVGQSLTLSRLDAGATYPKDDFIDVGVLLQNIISHCDFESELLHRALENIIRNAIRYTEVNTSVDVVLEQYNQSHFTISISDHGPDKQ